MSASTDVGAESGRDALAHRLIDGAAPRGNAYPHEFAGGMRERFARPPSPSRADTRFGSHDRTLAAP